MAQFVLGLRSVLGFGASACRGGEIPLSKIIPRVDSYFNSKIWGPVQPNTRGSAVFACSERVARCRTHTLRGCSRPNSTNQISIKCVCSSAGMSQPSPPGSAQHVTACPPSLLLPALLQGPQQAQHHINLAVIQRPAAGPTTTTTTSTPCAAERMHHKPTTAPAPTATTTPHTPTPGSTPGPRRQR